jgi:hypothetical protein
MKSTRSIGTRGALSGSVRDFVLAFVLVFCGFPLQSATLERLTFSDMALKSTLVVRGKVLSSYGAFSGGLIFTHYQVKVSETLKGHAAGVIDVAVPGGVANGIRQPVSGAPEFQPGDDYVFFLWTGKAGVTQIIGLTQGLFEVTGTGADPSLARRPSHELMLDARTHRPVKDEALAMRLSELRSAITTALRAAQ